MRHVMLDLETLGTSPGCCIASIGAVAFDSSGVLDAFYGRAAWGGHLDPSTIQWWLKQDGPAREALLKSPRTPFPDLAAGFLEFLGDSPLWGNGADFDNAILAYAVRSVGLTPWSHRANRCYRTMKSLVDIPYEPPVIPHHPLHDAEAQANHLIKIYAALGREL